ncbi:hypothetical protein OHA77_04420 [Streptosporangium sp. NBC_01639]|uniref:DUF6879 family protein n=1 Tax=Streptosporangium sp. NBC_01639 TaxID=2975948 RepID=UPI00386377CE|nr:hypothetical protein OHA77_04420 [Streptosporangium sp. NBC_01639]
MTRFVVRPEFTQLVLSFQHVAFRLEVRDRYNEPSEAATVRAFLDSGEMDGSLLATWAATISQRTKDGQRMERVRVVSEPHSDYTRFGLALAAHNTAAGEDIRYLPRDQAVGLDLPDHDFWLIDSTTLLILRFGDDDVLLGADLVTDPAVVVKHCYYRDVARHYAAPWIEYKERVDLPEGP